MRRPVTPRLGAAAALAGLVALAACASVPRPRLYQVEGATEILEGTTRARLNAYRTCAGSSLGVEALVACMNAAGHAFIPLTPEPPAPDCWRQRERADGERPPAYCFQKRARNAAPPP